MSSAETASAVTYSIDKSDSFLTVNEGWSAFATANDGERLLPPPIIGTVLWHWIADATTREIYRSVLRRVRDGEGDMRFCFRCDSPDQRRLLQMQIAAGPDASVKFQTRALIIQPRSRVLLLSASAPRAAALLIICAWCAKIPDKRGTWLEVEDAIESLRLFEGQPLPQLSHGICSACAASMEEALGDDELGASGSVTMGAF